MTNRLTARDISAIKKLLFDQGPVHATVVWKFGNHANVGRTVGHGVAVVAGF